MPLDIHIGIVAYALADELGRLLTALNGPDVVFHLFLHSTNPDVENVCLHWGDEPNVRYHAYRVNRGLATSWNDTVLAAQDEGADAILILNDDLIMTREDMLIMAQAAVEHREAGVIVAEGQNLRMAEHQILGYAAFGLNPVAIETVGMFDQNLIPYCYEDSDHSRRCALSGLTFHNAGRTNIIHTGSATVGTVPALNAQNQRTFGASGAFYSRKWGGPPGGEVYRIPFNDEAFDLKIDPARRFVPYPGYNRTDLEELIRL